MTIDWLASPLLAVAAGGGGAAIALPEAVAPEGPGWPPEAGRSGAAAGAAGAAELRGARQELASAARTDACDPTCWGGMTRAPEAAVLALCEIAAAGGGAFF